MPDNVTRFPPQLGSVGFAQAGQQSLLGTGLTSKSRDVVIEGDTERLAEMRLLVAFALNYRRGHVQQAGASGDLGTLAEVEQRILKLAQEIVG